MFIWAYLLFLREFSNPEMRVQWINKGVTDTAKDNIELFVFCLRLQNLFPLDHERKKKDKNNMKMVYTFGCESQLLFWILTFKNDLLVQSQERNPSSNLLENQININTGILIWHPEVPSFWVHDTATYKKNRETPQTRDLGHPYCSFVNSVPGSGLNHSS